MDYCYDPNWQTEPPTEPPTSDLPTVPPTSDLPTTEVVGPGTVSDAPTEAIELYGNSNGLTNLQRCEGDW